MCNGCWTSKAIVAASNVAYFLIAYWMWKHGLHLWWVLVIVGIVSIIFHLDPSSKSAYYTDILVANLAILSFFIYYRKQMKNPMMVFFATLAFSISLILFFDSGDDRESTRYVVMHSLWHVFTALSVYFFVKSSVQLQLQGGFKPRSLFLF